MSNKRWLYVGLLAGAVLTLGILMTAPRQDSLAEYSAADRPEAVPAAVGQAPLVPETPPPVGTGSDEVPPANVDLGVQAVNVLPTPVPGSTLLYFIPTDNDATATVLYLYNTDNVAHVVPLRGFSYNGVLVYSLNINIGANSFLRMASDSIASAPPPSWATPAPVITNFTDFTYFASLDLPKGVKVEGYTVFNPGTGVVDPRGNQGAIPLRFSTDPASVFLPAVQNNATTP